jgi:hypothetical protein
VVDRIRVIAEALEIAFLGADGLLIGVLVLDISEGAFRPVLVSFHGFLLDGWRHA